MKKLTITILHILPNRVRLKLSAPIKDTKTFYHILLKIIRGLISSKTKSQLKIRLSLIEPKINILQILAKNAKGNNR